MFNLINKMTMDYANLSKQELVRLLVSAAVEHVERSGTEQVFQGLAGPVGYMATDSLKILYRTPKAMAHGESNYGIDIWYEGKKVLSICWNSNLYKDYEVVSLKRGPWIPAVLDLKDSR
jgi:hypothetical protein